MKKLLAAIRFLTVVPVPGRWGTAVEDLTGSTLWFPLVGLLIGGVAAAVAVGAPLILPPLAAATVLVGVMAAASGALHLDGLADTIDGFLSSRPRDRILEIMRDSRIGTMGVLGLAAALLLKVTALGSLPRETLWRAAVLMPLAGRCALVLNISLLSYARPEGGLATAFFEGLSLLPTAVALALLFGAAWLLAQWTGLAAASAAVLGLLVFALWCRAKIGGATGDTLGAGCEITETVVALAMAAVTHTGGTI